MKILARLWPEERIAALFFLGVAALFAVKRYPFTILPLLGSYLAFLGSISLIVLPGRLAADALRRRRGTLQPGAGRADLLAYLRALVPLLLVLVTYTNLKCRLLLFHPRLFDPIFKRLDELLHYGGGDFLAWVTAHHSQTATIVCFYLYFYAWAVLAVPLAVAVARPRAAGAALARRTFAALGLCYIAGAFLYLAFPSLGPALVEPGRYAALAGTTVFTMQQSMLAALHYIVQHPQAPAIPFAGLAAFPSLHLATTSLGLFIAWKSWRPLLFILVPWNLAIAASAVYYGWHYMVDFYPALLLAWGAWWAAGRLVAPSANMGPSIPSSVEKTSGPAGSTPRSDR
ncbi:MAG: phosphatase PAP2 family protein [Thermoanaerobaculia bacterium]